MRVSLFSIEWNPGETHRCGAWARFKMFTLGKVDPDPNPVDNYVQLNSGYPFFYSISERLLVTVEIEATKMCGLGSIEESKNLAYPR